MAPPPDDLAPSVAALDARRRQLLEALLKERAAAPKPVREAPIPRLPRDRTGYRLSFAQERLWVIAQIEPGNVAYNLPYSMRLTGRLRREVLAAVFTEIVRRHETLRTRFAATDDGPQQVVAPARPYVLREADLSALPAAARESELARLVDDETSRPFDLAGGPVMRVILLGLSPAGAAHEEHALLFTLHHIASDGWSLSVLVREVVTLYEAFAAGRPSPLPPLPIQYVDYAEWQRRTIGGEGIARSLAYWRRQLAEVPVLELPGDRPRPPIQGLAGGTVGSQRPQALAEELKALGRTSGATFFMVLTAAFQAVLARASGQLDVAVGTPVANRHRSDTEGLIGFFVNTLVLRSDLGGDPTFAELLARVRQVAVDAFEHGEVPFSRIVEEVRPERNLSHSPLFQVMCALANVPTTRLETQGLAFAPLESAVTTAMFDLNLTVSDGEHGLLSGLEYRSEIFDRTTVQRLLGHFANVLAAVAAAPALRLSELPLLSAGERQALLVEWNDTGERRGEAEASLERLLAAPTATAPEATALVWERPAVEREGAAAWSFREAGARVERLARQLRGRGIGPGARVAICAERSPEMVVAVLATLAAGAAYVPLDPAYPAERLAWMLADSGAAALLAQERLRGLLPPFAGSLMSLDAFGALGDMAGDDPLPETAAPAPLVEAAPEDLAYVIYTSGSTGKPKGVAMTRRALVNLVAWQETQMRAALATLQFASLSFDVSFQEIVSTWAGGGTLALVSEGVRRDPRALLARLAHEAHETDHAGGAAEAGGGRIERVFLPFVALRQLAQEAAEAASAAPAPAEVVTAGEQLQVTPAVAAWLQARGGRPAARLHNHYGPTETHVVTAWTLAGEPAAWPPLPPVGRPIANVAVYLLDAQLAPVAIGVTGELCVGGAALARGYLGRPELTAERFAPDPFGGAGERLYHTGDLARFRADGAIEYLGRRDGQVKIRGVRIEVGEVEAALLGHPAIAQAVVVARPEPASTALRLVAYFAPRGEAPSVAELRDFLQASLPAAFLPAVFLPLASFPLTPSGKVDRGALARSGPLPEDGGGGERVAPRGATEELLAGIWRSLLGLAQVGATDNFFELGGHSLLATQLVSRIRQVFAVELPQRALFEVPTIAGLAPRIAALAAAGPAAATLAPIRRYQESGPAPLSFAQERLWLIDRIEPGTPIYNLPAALRLVGAVEPATLAATLGEIVRRHETLRTRFAPAGGDGGHPVQIVEPPAPFALPLVDLGGIEGGRRDGEVQRLAAEEAMRSFDLLYGPVLRALLLRLRSAGDEHALLFTMHHIASDGWSSGILVQEVTAIYPALAAGRPSPLPPLPIRYVDYARWQRETLSGEALEAHLGYWRRQLGEPPEPLALPTDRPRPPLQRPEGGVAAMELAVGVAQGIKALGRRESATLFMVVAGALQALLARLSGQTDLAIGTPVAGRERAELEGLIGFFVNTLVLRTDLGGDPPFSEILARVRQTALGAYAHQELPFERLVEELNPERSLAHTPLFQVMCVMQNAPTHELALAGLALEPLEVPATTTKFDLTLSAVDAGELGMGGSLEYRTDLFDATTARRLLAHLETLLAAIAEHPETPLSRLPLLAPAERAQLLLEWSGQAVPAPAGEALLQTRFEALARAAPDAPALLAGDERLSYGELDNRAELLAARLRALGVGAESRVGICVPRSTAMVVAVLAALKAGGAYVPLDPAYPSERLAFMIADSGLAVLLAGEDVALPAPAGGQAAGAAEGGPRVVRLGAHGADRAVSEPPAAAAAVAPASPQNLAYVIYTSGSTGRPKGVAVTHRAIVQTLAAALDLYALSPGDRVLQASSLAFDVAVLDLFVPLSAGACLCLPPGGPLSGAALAAELRERRINAVFLTPSVLATLGVDVELPDLRTLAFGAELCPPELVRRWSGGRRMVNLYGPTEAAIFASAWLAGPFRQSPPIGRPVGGARIHVVDGFELSPIGVPGEILLGGENLARGYLDRPQKTAESFVPDPFAATAGGRLYRTGDLARWLPEGELEMLGRIDHQVKVRGFRIELGEIEAALAEHPDVAGAAVALWGTDRLAAYFAARPGADAMSLVPALRAHLRERLPEFMLPAAFVPLAALPITASGKLDRRALPAPDGHRGAAGEFVAPRSEVEGLIAAIWQQVLGVERVGTGDNFFDLGGHSLLLVEVQAKLRERLGEEVALLDLFKFPSVGALAGHLHGRRAGGEAPAPLAIPASRTAAAPAAGGGQVGSRDIAVVGMACRFPGAADVEQFWQNLRQGVESISFFSREEQIAAGFDAAMLDDPRYVPASGVLAGADLFDAAFFDVSPREARRTDPQHRVFLEVAAEALERAGYAAPGARAGERLRVGVYAGGGMNSYGLQGMAAGGEGGMDLILGNDKDFLATRVSYKLNLRGPALAVQTACSTSLVAIHLASQALLAGECDLALAGGVTIQFPQGAGYFHEEGGTLSPDGHNRAFDARAGGTLSGDGAGVVVLKALAAALADGDHIHAVVKATAINNDGSSKIGFMAPSEEGQAEVIAEAQALAGVAPATVRYVEAHGSATPIGDPIEVAALTRAFRAGGPDNPGTAAVGFCAVGSVKSNVGHTGAAAGVAGFIKAVLAVERGEIPPSLHYEHPNPAIDFAASPFYVASRLTPWPAAEEGGAARRAGVSAFGLGGTNAHAVLEQAPERAAAAPGRSWQLLSLAARSSAALEAATDRLAAHLASAPDEDWADIAYSLHVGRRPFEHRRMVVAKGREDAAAALASRDPRRVLGSALARGGGERPVAFLFSGLGEQYPGLAAGLYRSEPAFREPFDRCAEGFLPELGLDLRELLFPAGHHDGGAEGAAGGGSDLRRLLGRDPAGRREAAAGPLDRTAVLQPALFAVEVALASLWREWGIEPRAMLGYSLGEYVAAWAAGVMPLDGALRLVAERARLIDALPEGAMLALSLSEDETVAMLSGGGGGGRFAELSLAAVNGPGLSVVAGPPPAVAAFEEHLAAAGCASRRLRTTHAFHSRMMLPAAERLTELARRVELKAPRIPYLSNVTGTWITAAQATDPGYWAEHLCRPVRFGAAVAELWREPEQALLEIGPGRSLATLCLQHPAAAASSDPVAVGSLRSAYERLPDRAALLETLGKLWLAGVELDWPRVYGRERRRRLPLPTYAWEHKRYWLETPAATEPATATAVPLGAASPADALYAAGWRRSPAPAGGPLTAAGERWLVFAEGGEADLGGLGGGLGSALATRLRRDGAEVAVVRAGAGLAETGGGDYAVDPSRAEDYSALLAALTGGGGELPSRIVHLWSLDAAKPGGSVAVPAGGFHGLPPLLRALGEALAARQAAGQAPPSAIEATIVTRGVERVSAADTLVASNAPLAAVRGVLPQEVPGLVCRTIDLGAPPDGRPDAHWLAAVVGELAAAGRERPEEAAVAYRGRERWAPSFEPVPFATARLSPGSAVVALGRFAGGLREAAEHLERTAGATIATIDGGADPATAPAADRLAFVADPADGARLGEIFAEVESRLGPLRGVLIGDLDAADPVPRAPLVALGAGECDRRFAIVRARQAALLAAVGDRQLEICLRLPAREPLAAGAGDGMLTALDLLAAALAAEAERAGGPPAASLAWLEPGSESAAEVAHLAPGLALDRLLAYGAAARFVASPLPPWTARAKRLAAPAATAPAAAGHAAGRHPRPKLRNPYVAPASELERSLTAMWQELLGIEEVGIHDSFFDLGGDSLLGTQVITRVRERFGVDVPLAALFELPTAGGLAARIEAERPVDDGVSEPERLERMLARLEDLTPEEVERMLAERGAS